MSLTDLVSSLNQPWIAEAGLVLFGLAFLTIISRLFRAGHREHDRAAAAIPLSDAPIAVPSDRTP